MVTLIHFIITKESNVIAAYQVRRRPVGDKVTAVSGAGPYRACVNQVRNLGWILHLVGSSGKI